MITGLGDGMRLAAAVYHAIYMISTHSNSNSNSDISRTSQRTSLDGYASFCVDVSHVSILSH